MNRAYSAIGSVIVAAFANAQSVVPVTNLFDSGAGSFRNAVAIAFPLDTIRFEVTGTITVLNAPITYGQSLVIEGPGMDLLTLSGNDLEVPLVITGGSTWVSGLSIAQGRETQGNVNTGAGMGFVGDTLVMNDVRISDCAFTGSGGNPRYGGGLRATAARVRITNCLFTDNYVLELPGDNGMGYGGGLAITSPDIRMTGSIVKRNTSRGRGSSGSASAYGGGLYLNGDGVIEDCVLDSNTVIAEGYWQGSGGVDARGYGGGVYIADQSNVALRNTSVSNNTITLIPNEDPYYYGGGLYVQRADLVMEDCVVNNNYIVPNQLTLFQSLGGGLCVWDGALTLRGTTLDGNTGDRGSGICFDEANNTYPVHALVLERTRVLNGTGRPDGAAVYVWPSDAVRLSDVEISGNSNRGLNVRATDNLRVERTLFQGNSGGGALVEDAPMDANLFLNCTFEHNMADQGAGIFIYYQTDLQLVNCTFMNDSVPSSQTSGREILVAQQSSVVMKNCIISSSTFQPVPAYGTDSGSSATSGGGNIARDASFASFFTQPNDLNSSNPQMDAFDDHGGFTRTWSLASNSTSIDQGGADTLSVDGRGYLRDGISDAGAFEFGAIQPDLIIVNSISPEDTVCVNHELLVSVDATSGANINYQWHLNGTEIPGATLPTYITTATLADGGQYTCVMTTTGDTVTAGPIEIFIDICGGMSAGVRESWQTYPQPTSGLLWVLAPDDSPYKLIIRDATGRLMDLAPLQSSRTALDVHDLPPGLFILEAEVEGARVPLGCFIRQ